MLTDDGPPLMTNMWCCFLTAPVLLERYFAFGLQQSCTGLLGHESSDWAKLMAYRSPTSCKSFSSLAPGLDRNCHIEQPMLCFVLKYWTYFFASGLQESCTGLLGYEPSDWAKLMAYRSPTSCKSFSSLAPGLDRNCHIKPTMLCFVQE